MTVQTNTVDVTYDGSDSVTEYPIPFPFLENSHIKVYRVFGATKTLLTYGPDYTILGAYTDSGGVLKLTVPLGATFDLYIERFVPLIQPVDLRTQGPFLPEVHEKSFDRLAMLIQQLPAGVQRLLDMETDVAEVAALLGALDARLTILENTAPELLVDYDLSLYFPGTPGAGNTDGSSVPIFQTTIRRELLLPQNFGGSSCRSGVKTAGGGFQQYDVKLKPVENFPDPDGGGLAFIIGKVTFGANTRVGVFEDASEANLAALYAIPGRARDAAGNLPLKIGDELDILEKDEPDPNLKDLQVVLKMTRFNMI